MIRFERSISFSFVGLTSTIKLLNTLPIPIILIVEIIFKISFCAVPDFNRVEPVKNSGPASTSIGKSACLLISACLLQEIVPVTAPIDFA